METTTDYTQGTSSLLIQDRPLQVLPSLALKVGLNEAIILQQVHFWLQKSEHLYYGKQWIYNTYEDWQEQFPFWSISTIRRAVTNLEKNGYLITRTDLNKMKIDNTKWYTIDYNVINSLKSVNRPPVQNGQTTCSKWTSVSVQNEQANNHRSPKNTTIEQEPVKSKQQISRQSFSKDSLEMKMTNFAIKQIQLTHPHLTFTAAAKQKHCATFRDLVGINKKTKAEIRTVLTWLPTAARDKNGFCWADQLKSPSALRRKNQDGIYKFDMLFSAMEAEQNGTNRKLSIKEIMVRQEAGELPK